MGCCDGNAPPAAEWPTLTIGMAVYDDFPQAAMTLQALRLYHRGGTPSVELLVVDNHPTSRDGERLRATCVENGARYVPYECPVGTSAPRDAIFEWANGEIVCVIDAHVLLEAGVVQRLREFAGANRHNMDLWQGPMLSGGGAVQATHMEPEWGSDLMFGKWAVSPGGLTPLSPPFEIPMHGLGLFACRREAWLGFPPGLAGFGGEEGMIHEKFRQAGRMTLCLPFLRWWHLFRDELGAPPFRVTLEDKFRNYLIWDRHLGLGEENFLFGKFHSLGWYKLCALRDSVGDVPRFDPSASSASSAVLQNETAESAEGAERITLDRLFRAARDTPSDINEHCETLRRLAAECEHVTEFGVRHAVSTVALLAGQPKRMVSYDVRPSPEAVRLRQVAGPTEFVFRLGSSLEVEIEDTDLLFLDTIHTKAQVAAELARHAGRVRRYLVFHDTEIYGEVGDDGGPGILHAIRDFKAEHPEWRTIINHAHNNGLLVLERQGLPEEEGAEMPGLLVRGWSLAKAVTRWGLAGLKLRDESEVIGLLAICAACPRFSVETSDPVCLECGCSLERKAAMATENCPLGKWGALGHPIPAEPVAPVCDHKDLHSAVHFQTKTVDGKPEYLVTAQCVCKQCGIKFSQLSGEVFPLNPE